jgi:mannan endo-1,4-beta-mannosidase
VFGILCAVYIVASLIFGRPLFYSSLTTKQQNVAVSTASSSNKNSFIRTALTGVTVPTDGNANAQTKKVLELFYSLYATSSTPYFLIGQNIRHANAVTYNDGNPLDLYKKYVTNLEKETGKIPAILAIGYGWEEFDAIKIQKVNTLLIDHWKSGGLVAVSMNPGNPWTGVKGSRSLTTGVYNFDDLFVVGSVPYNRLTKDLDIIAQGLQELSDAGVVVLWRPCHEMNGGWAWWSFDGKGDTISLASPENYKKIWNFSFDYLTKKKGLHNLLFVYSPNATYGAQDAKSVLYYYPGNDKVDILGVDYYRDTLDHLRSGGDYEALASVGKPIGFGEVGSAGKNPINLPVFFKDIGKNYPQMSFGVFWSGWSSLGGLVQSKKAIIESGNAKEFMNSSTTGTLDTSNQLRNK